MEKISIIRLESISTDLTRLLTVCGQGLLETFGYDIEVQLDVRFNENATLLSVIYIEENIANEELQMCLETIQLISDEFIETINIMN